MGNKETEQYLEEMAIGKKAQLALDVMNEHLTKIKEGEYTQMINAYVCGKEPQTLYKFVASLSAIDQLMVNLKQQVKQGIYRSKEKNDADR